MTFEKLLRFRRDTHYAALNLGGTGPDYGECCVRLNADTPLRFATSFAGDPLRVVFDDGGTAVLSDSGVLERFSTYTDRAELAAVAYPRFLTSMPVVAKTALAKMLDDRETIIEVHIHGTIRRKHVLEIAIQPDFFASLARRCLDYEDATVEARRAKLYDNVIIFKQLLKLTDLHQIRIQAEG
jgi:hypothetical protein